MTLYLDSSALVKRYVAEAGSEAIRAAIEADPERTTSRLTIVEAGRAIVRALAPPADEDKLRDFRDDLSVMALLDVDRETLDLALDVARETGVRTLDAIHLASLWKIGPGAAQLLTADRRQSRAAFALGLAVHEASTS